jgi:hypothetical protein
MIIAGNVGQNMGVVMPDQADVREDVDYGWQNTRTGTLDPGCALPSKPTIINVIDDGNADSITVTVSTNPETNDVQLYYRQRSALSWISGSTRTGSGDIIQAGLVAGTWYEMYAVSLNPGESAPSNLVTIYLAEAEGTGTLKSAIYTILMGDDDVQGIVDGRVTPGGDPMRGQASVTYHIISSIRGHTMDGPDTLATPTLQVNSYGSRDYTAENLADAVRRALDGFSGTVNGVSISYIALDDEGDLDDFEPGNRKISRHGVRQDYLVTYTEN